MTDNIYISVITVNYNGMEDTCHLINSLKQHFSGFSYEIIVVDNASSKNEADCIHARYPDIQCISSKKNLGFAGGNNLGISRSKGKYILLLNNDTYIEDNSLFLLAKFLDSNPSIGAVSPKIKFANSNIIQFAGYTPLSKITLRNRLIGFEEIDNEQYNESSLSSFLHGAAMMLKRDVIEKVGMMSEIYFLYYEELDWCEQIKKKGFELWYVPLAVVYHKESSSVGQESPLRCYYLTRNRLLYAWKNRKGFDKYLSLGYQFFIANPKRIIAYTTKGRFDLAKACIKGMIGFINMKKSL